MARTKSKYQLVTKDLMWDLLGKLGKLKAKLNKIKADADLSINKIKEQRKGKEAPLKEEVERIVGTILHFLMYNRKLFISPRSWKHAFGKIGWRKVREDKLKVTNTERALASLKEQGLDDCIRVKEEVDKQALYRKGHDVIAGIDGISFPEEDEEPFIDAILEPETTIE